MFGTFAEVFDKLEPSESPTLHQIIPSLRIMQEELAVSDEFEISESLADAAIRTLKMNLLDQINAHWVIKPEHRLATFLDHGYKHLDLANVDEEIVEFAVSNNFSLEYTKQVIFKFETCEILDPNALRPLEPGVHNQPFARRCRLS